MADDEIAVDGHVMRSAARIAICVRYSTNNGSGKCECSTTVEHYKSRPIKQNGRNCERTIGLKSGIARASTAEPFGPPRLSSCWCLLNSDFHPLDEIRR